jgi:hypothetical protein
MGIPNRNTLDKDLQQKLLLLEKFIISCLSEYNVQVTYFDYRENVFGFIMKVIETINLTHMTYHDVEQFCFDLNVPHKQEEFKSNVRLLLK